MANVRIAITFDDGPDDAALAAPSSPLVTSNHTEMILNVLADKGIKAAFFVQTHAPHRLQGTNGSRIARRAHSDDHLLAIHTGSLVDHRCHKARVAQPADVAHTSNGLDSDMARAALAIQAITGAAPKFVRATFGYTNAACMAVYSARGLKHVMWDVDSTDSEGSATQASVSAALDTQTKAKLTAGVMELIYLFHDIKSVTSNNLATFIGNIEAAVRAKGHTPKFMAQRADIEALLATKSKAGFDKDCPPWSI